MFVGGQGWDCMCVCGGGGCWWQQVVQESDCLGKNLLQNPVDPVYLMAVGQTVCLRGGRGPS